MTSASGSAARAERKMRDTEGAIVQAVGWWAARFRRLGCHLPDKIERHLLMLHEALQRARAAARKGSR